MKKLRFRFRINFWVLMLWTLLIGTAINFFIYKNILHWQKKVAQADFSNLAGDRIAGLQTTINTDLAALSALQSFFNAADVSNEQFSAFTGQLLRLSPHISSFHWIPRVPAEQRSEFEKKIREELKTSFFISEYGTSGGHFVAAKKAEEYYPTLYVEPFKKHALSLGFNQFESAERRRCMLKARDSKTMIATRLHPLWRFLPEAQENAYLYVYLPVYEKGKPSETLQNRREHLKGFVAAGLSIDPLIRAAYAASNMSELRLDFYAETVDVKNALIHEFQRYGVAAQNSSPDKTRYSHRETLHLADQRWLVIAHDTEFFKPAVTQMEANGFLIGGFLLILLLCSVIVLIELRKREHFFHSMSLRDELTNLYNRRGFLVLANEHLKLIRRKKMESLVLFADLDGLKMINDKYGHEEGDKALAAAASILKSSFRASDIIARTGGDEFAVFAFDVKQLDRDKIFRHLAENIERYNQTHSHPYQVMLSVGSAPIDLEHDLTLDRLLSDADKMMYTKKREHHGKTILNTAHFKVEPPERN